MTHLASARSTEHAETIVVPNPYDIGLGKNPANYEALTPLNFIAWSARVCPKRIAVIHGERRFTWAETYARARRLASALADRDIGVGATVATLLANTPETYEAHFGVPMAGAVLNTINTRLDASAIAFMLQHADAKVLIVDREFSAVAAAALSTVERQPLVIGVDDPVYDGDGELLGVEYEAFLRGGSPDYDWQPPSDEWNAISLNYTSGTTGNPKGVVYHHRGAYLNAIANILAWNMPRYPVYLWTLPMFHCNGWCFPWSVAAQSGTNVCLRKVDAAKIFELMREHRVDRPQHVAGRAARAAGRHHASRARHGCRCIAAGVDHRGPGAHQYRAYAHLRAHRGVRARDGVRKTGGVGGARA